MKQTSGHQAQTTAAMVAGESKSKDFGAATAAFDVIQSVSVIGAATAAFDVIQSVSVTTGSAAQHPTRPRLQNSSSLTPPKRRHPQTLKFTKTENP